MQKRLWSKCLPVFHAPFPNRYVTPYSGFFAKVDPQTYSGRSLGAPPKQKPQGPQSSSASTDELGVGSSDELVIESLNIVIRTVTLAHPTQSP